MRFKTSIIDSYQSEISDIQEEPKKKLVKKPQQRPVPGLVLSPRNRRNIATSQFIE